VLTKTTMLGSAAAALIFSAPLALAQDQDLSAVQFRTQQVGNGLYMLISDVAGNIALSTGPDGSVLVDSQFAPLNEKLRAAVRAAGGTDVKYVINTHWHFDHTGGNEPLGSAGAVIIAHDNVLTRMSTEQFLAAMNRREPPAPNAARPVDTWRTHTRTATRSCTSPMRTSSTRATRT